MAEVSFDLTVECASCGDTLNVVSETNRRTGEVVARVDPCPKCIDAAKDEGRQEAQE